MFTMSVAVLWIWTIIYCTTDLDEEWNAFKKFYNKTYDSKKELHRKFIFKQNLKKIQKHNIEESLGLHTYRLGVNSFADMSESEFETMFRNQNDEQSLEERESSKEENKRESSKELSEEEASKEQNKRAEYASIMHHLNIMMKNHSLCNISQLGSPPNSRDWRDFGLVSAAEDQGTKCGSCWAFSTTATVEAHYFIKTGRHLKLSTQNLVDCVRDLPTCSSSGCTGSWFDCSFGYIREIGINLDSDYPYEAKNGPCRFDREKEVITISEYCETSDEEELRDIVGNVGPVTVAVEFGAFPLMFYRSGIYDGDCSPKYFKHAVLVVGYGSQNGLDYWLIKNSFGSLWGDNGYLKISRNRNTCDISHDLGVYPRI